MGILHTYEAAIIWTGAAGVGTTSYTSYSRDPDVLLEGKPPLPGSSAPGFRGDPSRYCPEELMAAALAQCHMLWVLHLAASDGVVVVGYSDRATGRMRVEAAGHGQFTEVVLRPCVTIAHAQRADGRPITDDDLAALPSRAREHCFIARSVTFSVRHDPAPLRVAEVPTEPATRSGAGSWRTAKLTDRAMKQCSRARECRAARSSSVIGRPSARSACAMVTQGRSSTSVNCPCPAASTRIRPVAWSV